MNLLNLVLFFSTKQTVISKFKANDHVCIDDTRFMHFVSSINFFVKSCPKGLCFTRVPPNKNPCIGKELALSIDANEIKIKKKFNS